MSTPASILILLLGAFVLFVIGLVRTVLKKPNIKRPNMKGQGAALFGNTFAIIAHRGGCGEAPENTLVAFQNAFNLSPQIIFEFDLRQTKDSEIVVMHDPTIDRTTNGSGKVSEISYSELLKLDAGCRHTLPNGSTPYKNKSIRVPTLREVLQAFPTTRMVIEVKSDEKGIEEQILRILRDENALGRVVISSFNGRLLQRFKAIEPALNYGVSSSGMALLLVLMKLKLARFAHFSSNVYLIPEKHNGLQIVDRALIKEIHRRREKVFVWTINEEADMRRLQILGVDGLVTDRPSLLYKILNSQ